MRGMNITLRQIRVFCAVYELRSFTQAAQSLCITQSAVSKLCAELEHELGFQLFERSTRHVEICDGAKDLYAYAQEILGSLRAAQRSLSHLAGLERGAVAIACSPIMMHALLGPVIIKFHTAHPDVQLDLYEVSTDETIELVRSGRVDFGIVAAESDDPKLISEVIHSDPMFVVVNPGHPLSKREHVRWQDLISHHHIMLRNVYSVRRSLDRILKSKNLVFSSSIETGTLTTGLQMVRAGLGIAVMPGYIKDFARQLGLQNVPIVDDVEHLHELSLIRRAENRPSMAAGVFIDQLLDYMLQLDRDKTAARADGGAV